MGILIEFDTVARETQLKISGLNRTISKVYHLTILYVK